MKSQRQESKALMDKVLGDSISAEEIGQTLLDLRKKGEDAQEVLGFIDSLRARSVRVPNQRAGVIDVCGTGGDGLGTFNVSTVVAFIVAASGVPIAKHGNRSVSSRSGSFDVLETLGIKIEKDPARASRSLSEKGITFLFAPAFHPALAKISPIRKSLGVYTVFNLLGPLLNPVDLESQLMGVYKAELLPLAGEVLKERGLREAMVVHGEDGLDEITLSGETRVAHLKNGQVAFYQLCPEDFGLKRAPLQEVRGGDASDNAAILKEILNGKRGPRRDLVVMNAAAALVIAGKCENFKKGVELAQVAIDSGKAENLLKEVAEERSCKV